MVKRKTIGINPLDSLLQPTKKNEPKQEKKAEFSTKPSISLSKQRITVQISADTIERIKNAVYFTPGLTLAAFAEQAFIRAVDRLEKEKPFPKRDGELRTGRPIK